MFITEIALLLMYVGTPIVCLIALFVLFRWRKAVNDAMRYYAGEWQKLYDAQTDTTTYARSVTRALNDLEELRDNHENLYTQFKKFRSRVTMQQRREAEKNPEPVTEAQAAGESAEDWKQRMRLKHLSR